MVVLRKNTDQRFQEAREETQQQFKEAREDMLILRKDSDLQFKKAREDMLILRKDSDLQFKEAREETQKQFKEAREETRKRFDENQKRFDALTSESRNIQEEIKKIYITINGQTWKMVSAVGLIVLLGKLIETFGN